MYPRLQRQQLSVHGLSNVVVVPFKGPLTIWYKCPCTIVHFAFERHPHSGQTPEGLGMKLKAAHMVQSHTP